MAGTWARIFLAALLVAGVGGPFVWAHELRPAYLEIREVADGQFDVLWKVPARGDLRLGLYVRFAEDVQEQERTAYSMGDAHIERWRIEAPTGLVGQEIRIDGLATSLTDVLVRIQWLQGAAQTLRLDAATTGFTVDEAPGLMQLAGAYTLMGIEHILLGVDHLLFVLGLLWIVGDTWTLVKTITAFTVAHSISLAMAVLGVVEFPPQPVDAAIALSIVFLGAEVLHARQGRQGWTAKFPWIVAFGFGLLHGLGFAGALTNLGLPSGDIPVALLFFNVGVEIGQLVFVLVFLLLAWAFRTLLVVWPRWIQPLPAYAIGTVAMYWFVGRLSNMWW